MDFMRFDCDGLLDAAWAMESHKSTFGLVICFELRTYTPGDIFNHLHLHSLFVLADLAYTSY